MGRRHGRVVRTRFLRIPLLHLRRSLDEGASHVAVDGRRRPRRLRHRRLRVGRAHLVLRRYPKRRKGPTARLRVPQLEEPRLVRAGQRPLPPGAQRGGRRLVGRDESRRSRQQKSRRLDGLRFQVRREQQVPLSGSRVVRNELHPADAGHRQGLRDVGERRSFLSSGEHGQRLLVERADQRQPSVHHGRGIQQRICDGHPRRR